MSLGFGSRYEADSKTRSDIDEDSDAAVTKALKPIDQFIQNLAKVVSKAETEKDIATRRQYQRCVVDSIYAWAKADALNDMRTFNAKLSIPARIGGLAQDAPAQRHGGVGAQHGRGRKLPALEALQRSLKLQRSHALHIGCGCLARARHLQRLCVFIRIRQEQLAANAPLLQQLQAAWAL